jgi:hypothetical protein
VRALGQTALVCRKWKEVSAREELWVGIEHEVVPALWREEQGGRVAVGRGRLVQYGQLLVADRRVWSEQDWAAGLELHVEVFDRMDGLQMLSSRGALMWKVEEAYGVTVLRVPPSPALEMRGSSFSAATRDPDWLRFPNIGAYFTQGSKSEYPCSLCVRVTVRDRRTGKGGLLWEEGKETTRYCKDADPFWQERLPENGKVIFSKLARMVGDKVGGPECCVRFCLVPEPNQEGIEEQNRLYRVATGEDNHQRDYHPFRLVVKDTDVATLASLIRSFC